MQCGDLVGKCDCGNLGGAAFEQPGQPWPSGVAKLLGAADHRQRAHNQHRSEIAIARLGDVSEALFATCRVLLRHQPDPRCQVAARSEGMGIGDGCGQRRGDQWAHARDVGETTAQLIRAVSDHDAPVRIKDVVLNQRELIIQDHKALPCRRRYPIVLARLDV